MAVDPSLLSGSDSVSTKSGIETPNVFILRTGTYGARNYEVFCSLCLELMPIGLLSWYPYSRWGSLMVFLTTERPSRTVNDYMERSQYFIIISLTTVSSSVFEGRWDRSEFYLSNL